MVDRIDGGRTGSRKRFAGYARPEDIVSSRSKLRKEKPGRTARQVMRDTPPAIAIRANKVRVSSISKKRNKRTGSVRIDLSTVTKADSPNEPDRVHRQQIKILTPGTKDAKGMNVKLAYTCDCGSFTYLWEVALDSYGAAIHPLKSNGDWPVTTNPRGIPGACKHILAILRKKI